jgi:membrane protease YdiL (CAAX protease family)
MPRTGAILAGAAIFSLCHFKMTLHANSWGVFLTLGIGILGVITGFLFEKYRSLTPGFVFHAGYNLALLAISLLARR